MPWQELVAMVGGELVQTDDGVWVPAYRSVTVTVPRQSGKTTLVLSWEVQRCVGWAELGPQRVAYSAQTGNDARKKLIEDQVPLLEPHKKQLHIRRILRGMGNEAVEFTNGSRIVLLASSADSGHGKTLDLGVKDEYFADFDDRRDQALVPAMATKSAAQVLTTSTMGTDESVPLNRAVEAGRAAVDAGRRDGVAYFEWSAPADCDPDDPAVWWSCMPALGHTITEDVVRNARDILTDGEFLRAFCNVQTRADERVIPADAWAAVSQPDVAPAGALTFALDVNPERTFGSIATASGSPLVSELVDARGGVGWLVPRAVELSKKWGSPTWVVDGTGPAGSLVPDMERAGLRVRPVSARELIDACAGFLDGVVERSLSVRSDGRLDDAVAGAVKRQVGDAFAWTRKSALVDVTPLLAVTLALWGAREAGAQAPFFMFG